MIWFATTQNWRQLSFIKIVRFIKRFCCLVLHGCLVPGTFLLVSNEWVFWILTYSFYFFFKSRNHPGTNSSKPGDPHGVHAINREGEVYKLAQTLKVKLKWIKHTKTRFVKRKVLPSVIQLSSEPFHFGKLEFSIKNVRSYIVC